MDDSKLRDAKDNLLTGDLEVEREYFPIQSSEIKAFQNVQYSFAADATKSSSTPARAGSTAVVEYFEVDRACKTLVAGYAANFKFVLY